MFTASCFAIGVTRRSWLVDSGYTHHMSYDEKSFANLDRSFCAKVKIGNGDYIDVEGRGDVVIDGLKEGVQGDARRRILFDSRFFWEGDTQDSDEKQELLH
ncbi:hypothetical protein ZIOFF_039634 [Zingiber officinale]|uniref:Retrovirus-related Pol polyprotein from transposon TNT 1-94-like beta-barrel domain-containing protein n=1 Tax=Zingiber officinale TaxID=94328 RepID=A0A8J5KXC3_ZINOF|nr:hypothetical protein ZIOFF_039634 [Zingiber officinale]